VGGDARVGGEDAVGQANDGVQLEAVEQLALDFGRHAAAEEEAVGQDDAAAATGTFEYSHDVLEVEQRCLGGAHAFGEVVEDAALLFTSEWRIGRHYVHALGVANLPDVAR